MTTGDNWRNQIALGWVSVLLMLVLMLAFNIVLSALDNNGFAALRADPGRSGLRMLTYYVGVCALLPVLTYILHGVKATAVRWAMVALAGFNFLFLAMHHLAHWLAGERASFNSNFLDFTIHVLAVWIVYCSVRWARARPLAHPAVDVGAAVTA